MTNRVRGAIIEVVQERGCLLVGGGGGGVGSNMNSIDNPNPTRTLYKLFAAASPLPV